VWEWGPSPFPLLAPSTRIPLLALELEHVPVKHLEGQAKMSHTEGRGYVVWIEFYYSSLIECFPLVVGSYRFLVFLSRCCVRFIARGHKSGVSRFYAKPSDIHQCKYCVMSVVLSTDHRHLSCSRWIIQYSPSILPDHMDLELLSHKLGLSQLHVSFRELESRSLTGATTDHLHLTCRR
jgi:hypothetical protein